MELVVILLIGGEILLALKQGKDEDKLMDKQNAILSDLQTATSTTATIMKNLDTSSAATARTLLAVQSTMEQMTKASQGQLELFYDVSLNVIWDMPTKRLIMSNNGRTNISLLGYKLFDVSTSDWKEQIITPTGQYFVILDPVEKVIDAITKAGKDPLHTTRIPAQLYIKNAKGEGFVLEINMVILWEARIS